jgi:hypothetical protein
MSRDPSRFAVQESAVNEDGMRWTIIVPLLAGVVVLLGAYEVFGGRTEKLARMTVVDAHLALGSTGGAPVTNIDREAGPEVYYNVVLAGVPLGWPLELSCEWVDPAGIVARHNRYQTRIIYKTSWPTHCRQQLNSDLRAGSWQVRLLMGARVLSTAPFVLK